MTDRYSRIQPCFSRWRDGWLISMTTIHGWVMVQYPGDRPFIMSSEEWNALPEQRPWTDEAATAEFERGVEAMRMAAIRAVEWEAEKRLNIARMRAGEREEVSRLQREEKALLDAVAVLRSLRVSKDSEP